MKSTRFRCTRSTSSVSGRRSPWRRTPRVMDAHRIAASSSGSCRKLTRAPLEGVINMAKTRTTGNTTMNAAAGKIGSMLGRIAQKVDSVKRQRAEVAAELDHVIAVAQRMKQDMGAAGPDLKRAGSKVSSAVTKAR